MGGNRFLGTFRLADADKVLNDGAGDVDLFRLGIDVLPFQCEDLTSPQTCGHGQQDERPLSEAEIRQQALYFVRSEDVRRCSSLCALPHPFNGVTLAEVMAPPIIEQQAHDISYLAT